jgi:hypothetical protein
MRGRVDEAEGLYPAAENLLPARYVARRGSCRRALIQRSGPRLDERPLSEAPLHTQDLSMR